MRLKLIADDSLMRDPEVTKSLLELVADFYLYI